MKRYSKKQALANIDFLANEIKNGKLFVYPTNTLYGIGVNALCEESLKRLIELKERQNKPFLVIPPSIEWIFDNCYIINEQIKGFIIKNSPGIYSFVLTLKDKQCIHPLSNGNMDTVGVRIPDHWFYEIIQKSNTPFISSSANLANQEPTGNINNISLEILNNSDYVIECNSPSGKGSTIIDFTKGEINIIRK